MTDEILLPLISWGLPIGVTVLVVVLVLWVIRSVIPSEPSTRLYRQLSRVALFVFAILALLVALPLDSTLRGELLGLFGLVLTAIIALSSTTFVSNAMAGLMLKAVGSFHVGDFIEVGRQTGRVTEKALLHTEIQSEHRDLVTLPNLYLITNPLQVVRSSGTLISADVSIGYDAHRQAVTDLLRNAAELAGLAEPFVQITHLGDFSVSYRVAGFLNDVTLIVSKRSELRAQMLDVLHNGGVEIVSPTYMNQRQITNEPAAIPEDRPKDPNTPVETGAPERLMFDKAEFAARVDKLRLARETLAKQISEADQTNGDNKPEKEWRERQIASLDELIASLEEKKKEEHEN